MAGYAPHADKMMAVLRQGPVILTLQKFQVLSSRNRSTETLALSVALDVKIPRTNYAYVTFDLTISVGYDDTDMSPIYFAK